MASHLKTRIHPGAPSMASLAKSISAVNEDERRRMIAEAAYYRALERGFADGDPVQDWLEAEREVKQQVPRGQQQKEMQAAA